MSAAGQTALLLAGDVGGTKTHLALYRVDAVNIELLRESSYASAAYPGLQVLCRDFLGAAPPPIAAASFGIAGPVEDGEVHATNLPWHISATELGNELQIPHVLLANDLETTALGAIARPPSELRTVQIGKKRAAHRAVIAAGTGLGQAYLFWDGVRYRSAATEGGHVDFAPRTEREAELLRYLLRKFSRVSYERLLSGRGLGNIFGFVRDVLGLPVSPEVQDRLERDDPGAVVGEAGVAGTCPACTEAVEIFLTLYGAQAGNLALTVMALGGVYVGGGIIVRLLPRLTPQNFIAGFCTKGRFSPLLEEIPVHVVLNSKAALLGAAFSGAYQVRASLGSSSEVPCRSE
jgi:glucokinase